MEITLGTDVARSIFSDVQTWHKNVEQYLNTQITKFFILTYLPNLHVNVKKNQFAHLVIFRDQALVLGDPKNSRF